MRFALIASLFFLTSAKEASKEQPAPYSCFTCLGHNLESCEYGEATCNFGCMKVVDKENRVVAKGCQGVDKDPGPMHVLKNVKLPWADEREISGELFTCRSDFCNRAPALSFSLVAVLASLILAFLLA